MLNLLKMDFYRMFRMKSLWVIWFVMALLIVGSTYLTQTEVESESQDYMEAEGELSGEEPPNLGMNITVPTKAGEDVTVFDMVYANVHGKFVAVFIVIFAVLFSTADITSGYVKNIGGQVRNRGRLIVSKALLLVAYTVLTMGVYILIQAVSNWVFFGYIKWGNISRLLGYTGTEIFLHYALALICMTLAIVVRNNVFSMILSVLLCMNFMVILYSFVDIFAEKIGIEGFNLLDYTVTGKISAISMDLTSKEIISSLSVAAVFVLVMILIGSIVFEKRDI